jgi:hypothetical protein
MLIMWGFAAPALGKPPTVNRSTRACFGGIPETAASGQYDPKELTVVGHDLYWGGAGLQRLDLQTMKVISVDPVFHGGIHGAMNDIGPMDARQVFAVNGQDEILSFDLRTHAMHVLVPGELSATAPLSLTTPPFELDARYLYYVRNGSSFPRATGAGLFRIARDGKSQPEFLGSPPGGAGFIVDGRFVYYNYRTPAKKLAIMRRRLEAGSAPETVVELRHPIGLVTTRIFAGRLYYVDDGAIWSVAVGGGSPSVRHVETGKAGATDILAEPGCLYWSNTRKIQRAALDGALPANPEVIADEQNYTPSGQHTHVLATDGKYLYWPDAAGERIMRARRDPRPPPPRPEPVASWIGAQPRAAVTVQKVVVGDGWGCASYREGRGPHWQCWSSSASLPPPRIAARDVPWIAGDAIVAGSDRLCAMVDKKPQCWRWPDLLRQRPSDVSQNKMAWANSRELHVGGTFACSNVADVWSCFGDDGYGQLADGEADARPFGRSGALGTWHGCMTQGSDRTFCWGRGDGGQLGFPPPDTCRSGADRQSVACSRRARPIPFALPEGAYLVAGDLFTCAVTWKEGILCWGASRDGLFGTAAACPPGLRQAWPTRSGPVAAPNATCSAKPVAVVGIKPPFQLLGIGPRGFCAKVDGHLKCAGAIATPAMDVEGVTVSPGDQPSACGVSGADAVCWGAGYSPADNPGLPVHVDFDRRPVPAAVSDQPPRTGASWDPSCRIHFGCDEAVSPLAACAPGATAEPWSQLIEKAPTLIDTKVSVRGPLTLGLAPRARGVREIPTHNGVAAMDRCGPSACCRSVVRLVVIGGSDDQLALEQLECVGDDSRTCCNAPAMGQSVIATGTLTWTPGGRWSLKSPQVCVPPARD